MIFKRLRVFTLFSVLAGLGFPVHSLAAPSQPSDRQPPRRQPNIIVVLVDDAGYADFPCFADAHPRTPEIDRLTNEGIRFTQFYVNAPICSPSRAALITGQFPERVGITTFIASREENEQRGIRNWLDPDLFTLPQALKHTGYTTGHFGKWHLGGGRDVGDAPLVTEYGFDASLTQFEGLGDRVLPLLPNYEESHDGSPVKKLPLGRASEKLGRGEVTWVLRDDVTEAFVTHALQFIQQAEQKDQPFYVNIWPDDVHTPLFPPEELLGDGGKRERYLGVLENMDQQLGKLLKYVREQPNLRDNTLILVASDNGQEPGAGSAGDLRGAKGQLYEGGIREPLVVWGPGWVESNASGSTNETTVLSSVDVVASLLSLADANVPDDARLDGEDLSAALTGQGKPTRQKPLMWTRPPDRPAEGGEDLPDLAIREGKWKLLVEGNGSRPRLYDMEVDPNENDNLAGTHQEITKKLKRQVLNWRRSLNPLAADPASNHVFTNPIAEGADPWITQHNGKYLYCASDGNRAIAIHQSDSLVRLGAKHVVWRAPPSGPVSQQVWAPELHHLDNRWYVYFAASDGDNRHHLSYVLESEADDPFGPYTQHGPLYTGDNPKEPDSNRWAIDCTVLEHGGERYLIWSGWETGDDEQWLYIAKMKSPLELATPRVRLASNNDYRWERVDESPSGRGLHEGPQILQHGGRTFVVYSCSGSWQPSYKLGLLELTAGGDPLQPSDWRKHPRPVFRPTSSTYGVGHASFVKSPDKNEDWIVYHAKRDRADGWGRAIFTQPFGWTDEGFPAFGRPVPAGLSLELPSGTPSRNTSSDGAVSVPKFDNSQGWTYYGHHQFYELKDGWVHLGSEPREPVNNYRSGEKLMLNDHQWGDLRLTATVRVVEGDRDAGLLFRVQRPAVGYDAQEGYFAGLAPRTNKLIVGATDGLNWRQVAEADVDVDFQAEHKLSVLAVGNRIAVDVDGRQVLTAEDNTYKTGSIGLRVVDTEAAFRGVKIEPISSASKAISGG